MDNSPLQDNASLIFYNEEIMSCPGVNEMVKMNNVVTLMSCESPRADATNTTPLSR